MVRIQHVTTITKAVHAHDVYGKVVFKQKRYARSHLLERSDASGSGVQLVERCSSSTCVEFGKDFVNDARSLKIETHQQLSRIVF